MRVQTILLPLITSTAAAIATERPTLTKRDDPPPYGSVRIRNVQTSGSGCPPGSVSIQISLDQTTVTIGMTKMGAYYGPDYRSSENLRNCEIHADLTYPGGYQFSVMTATYNGYARLDPGVTGQLTSSYFFSQSPARIKYTRTPIDGPQYELGAPFQKVDTANDKTIVLSPCGNNGILNVNDILSIASRNRALSGELNVFDATISFTQQVHIQWRRCGSEDSASNRAGDRSKGSNAASATGGRASPDPGSFNPKSKGSGRGSQGSSGRQGSQVSFGGEAESENENEESTKSCFRNCPSGTFNPTVYSNDIGDLRKAHELTDFESSLKDFGSA